MILSNLAALINIKPAAIIERESLGDFPLILQIPAIAIGRAIGAIMEGFRRTGLIPGAIERYHRGHSRLRRSLGIELKSAPYGMRLIDDIAGIELGTVGHDAAIQTPSFAIEEQIALLIGAKIDRAITIEERKLKAEIINRFLISQNLKVVLFALILIEIRRV